MPTEKKPGFRKNWACAGAIAVLATAVVHAAPWAEADGFQHCRRDFIGTWQHTATVTGVDGGIAVQVGARSDGRTVRWQLEDGYLVARDDQPRLTFRVGTFDDQIDAQRAGPPPAPNCFAFNFARGYPAGTSTLPFDAAWRANAAPRSHYEDTERGRMYGRDAEGRVTQLKIRVDYVVSACSECEVSVVHVDHRFRRLGA